MEITPSGSVPVFNCVVYMSSGEGGTVHARVANLPDLELTGANEREALTKVVVAFKQRVAACVRDDTPIPWIDPPSPPVDGEQTRYVPVHL